jgi:hypothetical protein
MHDVTRLVYLGEQNLFLNKQISKDLVSTGARSRCHLPRHTHGPRQLANIYNIAIFPTRESVSPTVISQES